HLSHRDNDRWYANAVQCRGQRSRDFSRRLRAHARQREVRRPAPGLALVAETVQRCFRSFLQFSNGIPVAAKIYPDDARAATSEGAQFTQLKLVLRDSFYRTP